MLFDVRTVSRDGRDLVVVIGDVDLATIPSLRAQLDRADAQQVVLDLTGVDLFDPLAFGLVIAASLRVTRRGARFAVVCPAGRPRELFAESGVDRILTVVEHVDVLDPPT